MTDRELLELAAKAAGIEIKWDYGMFFLINNGTPTHEWNPLYDDKDALRLAVKLGLYAATRRAIVRAAAEVGRNMK
jgi:hypothetical protein